MIVYEDISDASNLIDNYINHVSLICDAYDATQHNILLIL